MYLLTTLRFYSNEIVQEISILNSAEVLINLSY